MENHQLQPVSAGAAQALQQRQPAAAQTDGFLPADAWGKTGAPGDCTCKYMTCSWLQFTHFDGIPMMRIV